VINDRKSRIAAEYIMRLCGATAYLQCMRLVPDYIKAATHYAN